MTLQFMTALSAAQSPLQQAYLSDFGDYDVRRHERESARRAAAVDEEWTSDRAALSQMLVDINRRLGAPQAALTAAARLSEPGALAVVTGQQAGLYTGPLYTVYKAVGAIALARRMEELLGRPVVPVFWAATEDHDLEEADHAWLPDSGRGWRRLRYRPLGVPPGLSVGAVPLQDGPLERVLAGLAQALPGGYAGPQILEMVRESALAATTYGDWFCRLIAGLLGPLGLPVLDPMAPAARALAAPGVRRILACGPDVERALKAGVTRIEAVGLAPQVRPAPGEINLFFYPQGPTGPRQALVYTQAGRLQPRGAAGDEGNSWDVDHFLRLAGERPELFSGNVVTRPMLQDEMLPTLAYVAGPGEIAYYAQLKELYHALGRTMPLIWPRPSLTLVEPAVGRLLGRHGLSLAELPAGLDARRESLLRAADEAGVERLVESMRRSVDEAYQPVVPALTAFDAVLGDLAAKNRRRVLDETGWLAKKARQVLTQRCRTGLGQLERVRSSLWPRGGPQERLANIMYYLARYGPGLIEELAQLPVGPPFEHHYALIG